MMRKSDHAKSNAGRRPRLLVVVNYYPPDEAGGARVFSDMCSGLTTLGFDVTVRCAYPYYPEWKNKSGRNGLRIWRHDEASGTHVEHYGLYIPSDPTSLVQRLVHEASLFMSYLRSVPRSRKYDVVMAYCPTISTVAIGVAIKLLWRKPLWLNVQDLAAEAASGVGLVKSSLLLRSFLALQRWLFNRADVWSTITPLMADKLEPHRRRGQPLLLISNWLDGAIATELARLHASEGRSAPRDPVRLLYSGNLGMKQNLLALLKKLQATDLPFEFRVHGDGAQAPAIREWLDGLADPRFTMGPLLDAGAFAHVLFESDYYVITEGSEAGVSFMPSKFVVGVSAGLPALIVSDPDTPLGVEARESDVGPAFGWDQLDDVVSFLRTGARDPEQHHAWSENALSRAKRFDRDALVDVFATELRKMIAP